MRRNIDLIRLILLDLEKEIEVDLSSYSGNEVNYHKALLIEAGLLHGNVHYPSTHKTDIPDLVIINRITWEGHEFLDKARSDTVWNKAKSLVKEKGLSLSMDIVKISLGEAVKILFHSFV
ncbi:MULTISPECIES: DUF2513 domain-containing protein [Microcystis]|jgi:hypothetical protein|uniref:DUF2513 domain-containing protein n=5 Tax=Microcystis TaxID=1125 RepID=A0A857D793_MICAE|nr:MULTISPECIES: DUF2513 domain-containing protein [Microcystis]NCQ99401.1 DUF2513 domain-containing protein [Microcystis aeruginosa L211-11]NCR07048.1 DUF2513 domain-containing protein [Microcystis aeruginosa LG13-11]NCR32122.1 DUF2513 domain-containing protein [Microcystis aeruginosa L211-101]NCR82407.1 DUF2513 domain-containing protein [Microcystis aeruginosa K13-10]NCR87455.1 DUF2513 domain-containing protein [Microcystis aeruginosa K13-05]TRT62190.1 MAG: DUF2513 domain-containing protein